MEDIVFRLRLAQVSSCTCLTKTPEWIYHNIDCRYRILAEAADTITELREMLSVLVHDTNK